MNRKIMAMVAVLIMLALQLQVRAVPNGQMENQFGAQIEADKDETVYISLDSEGSVMEVNVVNRIKTPVDGTYIDYGVYENISSLSREALYKIQGDKIAWQLERDSKGFYYQGNIKGGELPFDFQIKYSIDDKRISASEIAGKKGRSKIEIEAIPNLKGNQRLRDKYFYQIQAEIDLDRCRNVQAAGATSIMSGRTQNIGFMLMPNKRDHFEISFDTEDFAFDGFTITSMEFDIKNMIDFDPEEMKDGFQQLTHASERVIQGTGELKLGMEGLARGIKDLSSGGKKAKSGLDKFNDGLTDYSSGISELTRSAKRINEELEKLDQGGRVLNEGFAQLKSGIELGFSKLGPIIPALLPAELTEMANQLKQGTGWLAEYEEGLNKFTAGVSMLSAGMNEFYMGMLLLERSGEMLAPGLGSIIEGMAVLTDGLTEAAGKVQILPKEIARLTDGQTKIKEGLEETVKVVGDFDMGKSSEGGTLSFVSEKNNPRSLQFIYKTAEIAPKEQVRPEIIAKEEKKGFFKRLADLFKR
ncbi:MAG: hypothetical protein GX352_03425 [Clostridiales bacterium]|nr:hypothetical protein [Clostridiales bacterium]